MAKRIVTRIGDIFSVTMGNGNQRFFQYVANDQSCLNSSVIRVFKKEYTKNIEYDLEEIVGGDVDFYAHTVLRIGIAEGAWQKVGRNENIGDTEHIMFRMYEYDEIDHKERIWNIWEINKGQETIGHLTDYYRKRSDIGLVFSYVSIVSRIEHGIYPGKHFLPEEN